VPLQPLRSAENKHVQKPFITLSRRGHFICSVPSVCTSKYFWASLYIFFPKPFQGGSEDSSEKENVLSLLRPKNLLADWYLKQTKKTPHPTT